MSWRNAHRWLRGLSDAQLGKPKLSETDEHYLRGYTVGSR